MFFMTNRTRSGAGVNFSNFKLFRSRSGVAVYSAKAGAESQSKILDSVDQLCTFGVATMGVGREAVPPKF